LVTRLVGLLGRARECSVAGEREARLVDGALALVSRRVRAGGAERLPELTSALTEILLAP
jgi:hypothetical protein